MVIKCNLLFVKTTETQLIDNVTLDIPIQQSYTHICSYHSMKNVYVLSIGNYVVLVLSFHPPLQKLPNDCAI